jgi:hypothetical protein
MQIGEVARKMSQFDHDLKQNRDVVKGEQDQQGEKISEIATVTTRVVKPIYGARYSFHPGAQHNAHQGAGTAPIGENSVPGKNLIGLQGKEGGVLSWTPNLREKSLCLLGPKYQDPQEL